MRRIAIVVVVVAVTVVTAALATSADGDAAQLTLPATDLRVQGVVTAVFVVAALVAIFAAAFARPSVVHEQLPSRRRSLLSTMVVILVAIGVATVLSTLRGDEEVPQSRAEAAEVDADGPAVEEVVVEPRRVATALLTLVVIGLLVALAVRSVRPRPAPDDHETAPLRSVVQAGRTALDHGAARGSARAAILACWRSLEAELAAAGRARRDTETGEEYLRRALAPLDPPADAVADLGRLVELARWSTAPLDDADVAVARRALDGVLSAVPSPPTPPPPPSPVSS